MFEEDNVADSNVEFPFLVVLYLSFFSVNVRHILAKYRHGYKNDLRLRIGYSKSMIILGVDPGSRQAGFGVIQLEKRKITYIDSGTLRYDHIPVFLDRIRYIYESCSALVKKFNPDEISLESLIFVKNVSSLAKLAQARGAMIAGLSQNIEAKVFEYSPNLVKSVVTGYGHADKEAVAKSIKLFLGVDHFKSEDESDALAISICHALSRDTYRTRAEIPQRSRNSSLKSSLAHLADKGK